MLKSYVIKRSAIHGRGLFATRSFVRGEVIGVYEGEVTSVNSRYVLWVPQDDGTEIGIKGNTALRFLNHSAKPNCVFNGDELAAIRPIKSGQELTIHYGEEWE
jgi:SET domain-containing protein